MKIGLLGGTFDPIHFGHIRPSLAVKSQLGLDKIWLMPNAIPPHKKQSVTPSNHRAAMVNLVCDSYPEFALCDIEINTKSNTNLHGEKGLSFQPSYTVNTLLSLQNQHPEHHFTFIMGADSLLNLQQWYQWQKILTLCHIAVCNRPNWSFDLPALPALIRSRLYPSLHNAIHHIKIGRISLLNVPPQAFSSTEIRTALSQLSSPTKTISNKQRNFLQMALPKNVLDYIDQHKLYQ